MKMIFQFGSSMKWWKVSTIPDLICIPIQLRCIHNTGIFTTCNVWMSYINRQCIPRLPSLYTFTCVIWLDKLHELNKLCINCNEYIIPSILTFNSTQDIKFSIQPDLIQPKPTLRCPKPIHIRAASAYTMFVCTVMCPLVFSSSKHGKYLWDYSYCICIYCGNTVHWMPRTPITPKNCFKCFLGTIQLNSSSSGVMLEILLKITGQTEKREDMSILHLPIFIIKKCGDWFYRALNISSKNSGNIQYWEAKVVCVRGNGLASYTCAPGESRAQV